MVLLLGSSGYVGSAFKKYLATNDIPYTTLSIRYPILLEDVAGFIADNKITSVINCSGYVGIPNVDACESDKNNCLFGNGFLPRQIAKICALHSINIPHVFVSSGCIFFDKECEQGNEPSRIFTHIDEPNFTFDQNYRSWYSGTKAVGELLLKPYKNTSICRLRIPFNDEANPRNFIYKAINYPKLVNTTNSFSNLDEFVMACYKISQIKYDCLGARTYNITQPGYLTTAEIVEMLSRYNLVDTKEYFKSYDEFLSSVEAPRSNCALTSCGDRPDTPFNLTPVRASMEAAIKSYYKNHYEIS